MSTLQLSLAIVGGIVLALVIAYNTWTSRRNTPRQFQARLGVCNATDSQEYFL